MWMWMRAIFLMHKLSFVFSSLPSILGRRATTLDVGEAFGPFYFLFSPPACGRCSLMATVTVQRCRRQRKKLKLKLLLLSARCRSRSRSSKSSFSFPPLLMNALSRGSTPPALVWARVGGVGAFCA
ncbi:hypothetical protein BGY98DRAFT_966853 [Russula aff. rugulosa BPL654]|nr:hypothetical protein BGY98DRAFT_966853 [Russula aff. rugulosa BPL654]